jgi:NAD(P) transhydrogenase subunit beta
MSEHIIHLAYLVSAACFILSLKWLSAVPTARRGVIVGVAGMTLAVGGTLLDPTIEHFRYLAIAMVVGSMIGVPMALMPMTAVPQRTALSHAFGALAATLVGAAEYALHYQSISRFTMTALTIEVILGGLTVTASLMAAGKLQEILPTRPMVFKNQNYVNLSVLGVAALIGVYLIFNPGAWMLFPVMVLLCLIFGVLLIMPIGGADMPTVLALLNSYAGLAASMMGFVLDNKLLIVAGALDGSSGLILSIIMCRAMNRSFTNVLFGAFGQVQSAAGVVEQKNHRSASAEEAADLLRTADSVIIVPGYGMAVAQAQHKVRELFDLLTKQGTKVTFAIHPVAGRMPGHMNVLLAEADIPYDNLLEMEDANSEFPQADVALVIGANDVTNPAARHDKSSPIYGMPILDVDKARTVMVIKRSMNPGFAGIDNELYYMDRTLMLFGDAKGFVGELVKALPGD